MYSKTSIFATLGFASVKLRFARHKDCSREPQESSKRAVRALLASAADGFFAHDNPLLCSYFGSLFWPLFKHFSDSFWSAAFTKTLKMFDFSKVCYIQCLECSWVLVMLCCALLEPKKGLREPRRLPGAPQEPPGRPQESPRGSQRLSSSSLTALLGLSWGSLEQAHAPQTSVLLRQNPGPRKSMILSTK